MALIAILVIALATYRVTKLIVYERGPFDLMVLIRSRFGIVHDKTGEPVSWPSHWVAYGFGCAHCVSFWVALAFALILVYVSSVPIFILACAGASSIAFDILERIRGR